VKLSSLRLQILVVLTFQLLDLGQLSLVGKQAIKVEMVDFMNAFDSDDYFFIVCLLVI
jgi:hypothetical protein